MSRLELFQQALADVERLAVTHPCGRPSKSAILQMRYLVELESGQRTDFERLADINIGLLTIRELGPPDPAVEERLYQVNDEADKMLAEWRRRTRASAGIMRGVEENPYKAPGDGSSLLRRRPVNSTFWKWTLGIGAFFWIGSTIAMIAYALDFDRPFPGTFQWMGMAAEWVLGGAFTLLAAIKLLRRA